jgi:hypothetical protein
MPLLLTTLQNDRYHVGSPKLSPFTDDLVTAQNTLQYNPRAVELEPNFIAFLNDLV